MAAFLLFAPLLVVLSAASAQQDFRFIIIGDRTGETVPGVYQRVWQEAAKEHPAFFITVGDTIEGLGDATVDAQWIAELELLKPYRGAPIYFIPGNHDIWSPKSRAAYIRYTGRPTQYSFDHGQAHFTIVDDHSNESLDPMPPEALSFLKKDLQEHSAQPLKFVFSHRPSWILSALARSTDSPLQKLARDCGVQFFVAGHIHQMLRVEVDGVTYLSMPSSGGHLRASGRYEDGWFFGYTVVEVHGNNVDMWIKELGPPFGKGRVSRARDWGASGLIFSN